MNQPMQKFVSRPRIIEAAPGEHMERECYWTRFPSGTEFWLPKEAFEADYIPLNCDGDIPEYQQRIFGEIAQLDENVGKLTAFLDSLDGPKIHELKISDLQLKLMENQLSLMMSLRMILLARIQEMTVVSGDTSTPVNYGAAAPVTVKATPIEQAIQDRGLNAPRVTLADIETTISAEYFFTAEQAVQGVTSGMIDRFLGWKLPEDFGPDAGISFDQEYKEKWGMPTGTNLLNAEQAKGMLDHVVGCAPVMPSMRLLTFCVLVLRNGFTVTGESACASPENFDAEIGRQIAKENAIRKIWPLLGYELRTKLASHTAE